MRSDKTFFFNIIYLLFLNKTTIVVDSRSDTARSVANGTIYVETKIREFAIEQNRDQPCKIQNFGLLYVEIDVVL